MKYLLLIVMLLLFQSCNDESNPIIQENTLSYNVIFTSDRDSDGQINYELGTKCEVYSMNIDGQDQTRLTFNENYDFTPIVSADGKKIVFTSAVDWLMSEIYIMNYDGTELINLGSGDSPIFSNDDSKILFRASGLLCTMNRDGTNKTFLTNWADSIYSNIGQDYPAQFSTDDKKILFVSRINNNSDIYTISIDGSEVKRLTNNPGYDGACSYSPDNSKILLCSYRAGKGQIFTMDSSGSNQTQLTATEDFNINPSYSPDGKRIIFLSHRDGQTEVYLMNSDGTSQRRLTNSDLHKDDPKFSPDGNLIIFQQAKDIYTINLSTDEIVNLTNGVGSNFAPSFGIEYK